MKQAILALIVGSLIGGIFRLLKLPVPVPHGWAGMLGLIGMFLTSEALPHVIKWFQNR